MCVLSVGGRRNTPVPGAAPQGGHVVGLCGQGSAGWVEEEPVEHGAFRAALP